MFSNTVNFIFERMSFRAIILSKHCTFDQPTIFERNAKRSICWTLKLCQHILYQSCRYKFIRGRLTGSCRQGPSSVRLETVPLSHSTPAWTPSQCVLLPRVVKSDIVPPSRLCSLKTHKTKQRSVFRRRRRRWYRPSAPQDVIATIRSSPVSPCRQNGSTESILWAPDRRYAYPTSFSYFDFASALLSTSF